MSKINDGRPACFRCGDLAIRKQGNQNLCSKHYRFGQMRASAKRHGKSVPSHQQLAEMRGANLICPDCGRGMNWLAKDGQVTVASLQHYRDGTMAIVCRSCNTRHAFMDGDEYREMPKDNKLCPRCKKIKPLSEFALDASRSGIAKRKSACRKCSGIQVKQWKESNRDQYNEYQRQYRAKRKAEGNPIHGGA